MSVEPDLFAASRQDLEPLAARMRPQSLDDVVGQSHLLGADQPLRRVLAVPSGAPVAVAPKHSDCCCPWPQGEVHSLRWAAAPEQCAVLCLQQPQDQEVSNRSLSGLRPLFDKTLYGIMVLTKKPPP